MADEKYPLTIKGELRETPSRALWLVKWLLLFPHIICLAGLWIAFIVVTVIAFFAVLFTGTYPKGMFDFNVGVLRWTWRVSFYGYGALATDEINRWAFRVAAYVFLLTDQYPPFKFEE